MQPSSNFRSMSFLGLRLFVGTPTDIAEWVIGRSRREQITVAHVNFYNYWLMTRREPAFTQDDNFTLVFEGIGMKLAAWILGNGWLPDANGTDMFPLMMEHAAKSQLKIFLLGATPSVLRRTVEKIRSDYPQVCLCGAHQGYFPESEEAEVIDEIQRSGADLLLISRGSSPHADFVARCRRTFGTGLIWNAGGLFDFVSGRLPRAPRWMRNLRLEWLFRLLIEPHRKAHRYFVISPWFLARVLRELLNLLSSRSVEQVSQPELDEDA